MATAGFKLSSKSNNEGKNQVYVRLTITPKNRPSFKSGIFVKPEFFRKVTSTGHGTVYDIVLPHKGKFNAQDVADATAAKEALTEYTNHLIAICNKMTEAGKEVKLTQDFIASAYELVKDKPVSEITFDMVDHARSKRQIKEKKEAVKQLSFFELCALFLEKNSFSEARNRAYRVLFRILYRFQEYERATNRHRSSFSWNIETIDRTIVEEFFEYMTNEHDLQEQNPRLFKRLLEDNPPELLTGHKLHETIEQRGRNVLISKKKAFKALWNWLLENRFTTNNPFIGIKIGTEKYGTPYYITKEERDIIADADLDTIWPEYEREKRSAEKGVHVFTLPVCKVQRDIFVFQCLIGCRVGDLLKMTPSNINGTVLSYIPRKTIDDKPFVVEVPLTSRAQKLIAEYQDKDIKDRLFPFISAQKYNDVIKQIFEMCGITRKVTVRDPVTGEEKQVRICDVASSHMARRTFIGNLYKRVKDPDIIGSMSGHVEGS